MCFEQQLGHYLVSNQALGNGAFGHVRLAIDRKNHRQLACKTIQTSRLTATAKTNVRKEVAILRSLAHVSPLHPFMTEFFASY